MFKLLAPLRRDPGALAIVALWLALLPISLPRIYATDEVQYYAYLRSVYFDGDLDFRNEYEHFAEIGARQTPPDLAVRNALLREDAQNPNPRTGKLRNVAPIGSAIMWAPGFVAADLGVLAANALGAGIARDGYSRPYVWSVCFMSALYTLGGLLLTYQLARRLSGSFAATLATITIWLASPLVMYTYILMPWSHATGFGLFALFLTLWIPLVQRQLDLPIYPQDTESWRRGALVGNTDGLWGWLLLGLVGGLMTMTREQLGRCLLLLALAGLIAYVKLLQARSWATLRGLLVRHVLFLLVFGLTLVPQLLAYQLLTLPPGPVANRGRQAGCGAARTSSTR
ncbi:MAG: hypothetical protein U0Z44_15830 [Kouleothrix sp.]